MKTREKILLISQEMFNRLGEPQVSTVDIATELEISPGNLYYHYRNKEQIVYSLFEKLEAELSQALAATEMSLVSLLDGWLHLKCLFEIIWQYRFLYRDVNTILNKNPQLDAPFKSLISKQADTIHTILRYAKEAELIFVQEDEQARLVDNILLITHFSMQFHNMRNERKAKAKYQSFSIEDVLAASASTEPLPKAIVYALKQIVFTLMPYLHEQGRELMKDLLMEIG